MSVIKYIQSDLHRDSGKQDLRTFLKAFVLWRSFKFRFWFRLTSRSRSKVIRSVARVMLALKSRKYGIQIPPHTEIGYGLYIGHAMGVIIHPTAKIGNNCNLSQFLTIGSNHGAAAEIGDNVYIGPSVCIVENVKIGNNVTIGAGSVVTKNIPDDATVAGVPAEVLSYKDPGRYIKNRWET